MKVMAVWLSMYNNSSRLVKCGERLNKLNTQKSKNNEWRKRIQN